MSEIKEGYDIVLGDDGEMAKLVDKCAIKNQVTQVTFFAGVFDKINTNRGIIFPSDNYIIIAIRSDEARAEAYRIRKMCNNIEQQIKEREENIILRKIRETARMPYRPLSWLK